MKVVCLYREERFSPGSVDKDRTIMDAVIARLQSAGAEVITNSSRDTEELLNAMQSAAERPEIVFSMVRDERLLDTLQDMEQHGVSVMNAPSGVRLCNNRYELDLLLRKNNIAVPPLSGNHGIWVKRGDASAEVKDDVTLCHTEDEVERAILSMEQRGIKSWIRQAHIPGDLVKFYGVANRFFTHSYPTDSGHSKFGLEVANGTAQHYAFDRVSLQHEADKIAQLTGVCIYGGDAIVREDGSFAIIDFNDWPTFSSCRKEAAKAIASLTTNV